MQHSHLMQRTIAASHRELDTKLELLQQLGYGDRFFLDDDASISDIPPKDEDTARWIQAECNWALEEAAADIPDLFDVAEDEEACPFMYDPTFFSSRQPSPPTERSRSDSLSKALPDYDADKPLPSVPPLKLRKRPSVPIVPPPSPAAKSNLSSPASTPPASPRSYRTESHSPPSSPRISRHSPRSHGSPSPPPTQRPSTQRHATYPSISSTLSLLEERETEAEKRSAVYVADIEGEPSSSSAPAPRPSGRGRSSSATVPPSDVCGPLPISPRRRQRPALPALATSVSSPQLRRLAELASTPSPSFSVSLGSPLLPSPMSDATVTPDTEIVSPGEAITHENPADETAEEPYLASRWSLDSVASRPRITQMALDDASSPPANKTKKRDRLLSLISPRGRSGSVTKPFPPPNTPRGSSDILDIRRVDLRDALSPSSLSSFTMPPKISMTPSMAPSLASSLASSDSSNASSASTLATPIEPNHPQSLAEFTDAFAAHSPPRMPEEPSDDDSLVFAENPYYIPESPLLEPQFPSTHPSSPSIPHQHLEAHPHPHEPLKLQIPERATSPPLPPPQPTLPLPSPGTPSPSFLVPSPRPQSFFASITGRQRRRKKKLVISGAPLELGQARASSAAAHSNTQAQGADDHRHRQAEQQRRVHNVVKWCESFGAVRKIETKEDGSLHVYWRDWEVADMVCRIQAQVVIKDVGRVNLAWYYIS